MRLIEKIIKESYSYDNYLEFESHKKSMKEQGYTPTRSTEDGYSNQNLENYYGEYSKVLFENGYR